MLQIQRVVAPFFVAQSHNDFAFVRLLMWYRSQGRDQLGHANIPPSQLLEHDEGLG
jgi:hypothetical protein